MDLNRRADDIMGGAGSFYEQGVHGSSFH